MPGTDREVKFCFLAQPTDVNFGGKVHGGMVMKWIDQGGYACAVGWSSKYCVTVAVGGIRFVHPILIGNLVTVHCQLIYTGTTSMHFCVDVIARVHPTAQGRDGKPLFLDTAIIGPRDAKKALLLMSATATAAGCSGPHSMPSRLPRRRRRE